MASAIDATKPVSGNPTTQSVRDNFAAAKSEIEALQAASGGGGGAVSSWNTRTGAVVLTTADIAALDLRTLPTADPGNGRIWINGGGGTAGALWVGPA